MHHRQKRPSPSCLWIRLSEATAAGRSVWNWDGPRKAETNKWLLQTVSVKEKTLKTLLPVITAGRSETAQHCSSLLFGHLYIYIFFPKGKQIRVFPLRKSVGKGRLTTRRNGAGLIETERGQGHSGHFFRNLHKEDRASAEAAGQEGDGRQTRAQEGSCRHWNQIEFLMKQNSEEMNGWPQTKSWSAACCQEKPLLLAPGQTENPIGNFYHLIAGRGH